MLRSVATELSPSYFLIRNCARIRSVTGRRIADLTIIAPKWRTGLPQILLQHRNDTDREIARNPAADLEKSDRTLRRDLQIPFRKLDHIFDPGPNGMNVFNIARDTMSREHISERRILPAWNKHRKIFLHSRPDPAVFLIDLKRFLKILILKRAKNKLVREKPLPCLVGLFPLGEYDILDPAHRFYFRNAGIRHPIHVTQKKLLFVSRCQIPIMRNALVKIVRHEVENILLEIRPRAADRMDFPLPDHFGQRKPQLRGTHRPAERHHHQSTIFKVNFVIVRRLDESRRVEVTEMMFDKGRNLTGSHGRSCN